MSNQDLIQELKDTNYLRTPIIIEAFEKIDRSDFVPENLKDVAYTNQALPIGEEQTISQPLTVAFMLELLEPQTGDKILDIGTGSGWQAALLAYVISKNDKVGSGKIVSIERVPELIQKSENSIKKYSFINRGVVRIINGDGSKGYDKEAPYDKIIAAAAGNSIPNAWKEQLKIGGKIIAPIDNSLYLYEKISEDKFKKTQYFGFSFVPLVIDN